VRTAEQNETLMERLAAIHYDDDIARLSKSLHECLKCANFNEMIEPAMSLSDSNKEGSQQIPSACERTKALMKHGPCKSHIPSSVHIVWSSVGRSV
jgi:hypothetical protein